MKLPQSKFRRAVLVVAVLCAGLFIFDRLPLTPDQRQLRNVVPMLLTTDVLLGVMPKDHFQNPAASLTAEKFAQRGDVLRDVWAPSVVEARITEWDKSYRQAVQDEFFMASGDAKVVVNSFNYVAVRFNSAHVEFQGEEKFNTWKYGWVSNAGVETFAVDLKRGGPYGWQLVRITRWGGHYG